MRIIKTPVRSPPANGLISGYRQCLHLTVHR